MSLRLNRLTVIGAALMAVAASQFAIAWLRGSEPGPGAILHTVTVVNRSEGDVYFKIVGGIGRPFADATLPPRYQVAKAVTKGEKVLCVWNMNGNLLAAWRVVVVGDRMIVIPQIDPSQRAFFSDLDDDYVGAAPCPPPSPPVDKPPTPQT